MSEEKPPGPAGQMPASPRITGGSRASVTVPDSNKAELLALYSMIHTNPDIVQSKDYEDPKVKEYAALMSAATAVDPQGVVQMLMEYASQEQGARKVRARRGTRLDAAKAAASFAGVPAPVGTVDDEDTDEAMNSDDEDLSPSEKEDEAAPKAAERARASKDYQVE